VTSAVIAACSFVVIGCTGAQNAQSNLVDQTTETNNEFRLNYIDAGVFDSTLMKLLTDDAKSIEINIVGEVSINDMPDRLRVWVDEAAKNGATVELIDKHDIPTDRGLDFGIIAISYYYYSKYNDFLRERDKKRVFTLTKNYDLDISYDAESGMLDRVILRRKPEL